MLYSLEWAKLQQHCQKWKKGGDRRTRTQNSRSANHIHPQLLGPTSNLLHNDVCTSWDIAVPVRQFLDFYYVRIYSLLTLHVKIGSGLKINPTTLQVKQAMTFTYLVRTQLGYGTLAWRGSATGTLEPTLSTFIEAIPAIVLYCVGIGPHDKLICRYLDTTRARFCKFLASAGGPIKLLIGFDTCARDLSYCIGSLQSFRPRNCPCCIIISLICSRITQMVRRTETLAQYNEAIFENAGLSNSVERPLSEDGIGKARVELPYDYVSGGSECCWLIEARGLDGR